MTDLLQRRHPLRILHAVARLNIGGPAVHVALTCAELRRRGHDTLLVCGRVEPPEGDMAYVAERLGIQPVYLPHLRRSIHPLADLRSLAGLTAILRDFRPHVLHTHTSKAGALGRVAALLAGSPAVCHTFHGHVLHGYFGRAASTIVRATESALARLTSRIVVLTPGQRDELLAAGIGRPAQVTVVPFGLDARPFLTAREGRAAARRQLGLEDEQRAIGIIGRLTAIKGHDRFLELAARLAAARPEYRFFVVGDGELRGELERRAGELGLRARTRFLGWLPDPVPLYGALDLLVLTSRNEGSPVVLKEAMAAGLPCAAFAVGGVGDLLVDGVTGWPVPDGDFPALHRAVEDALTPSPPRDAILERAREKVEREHSVEAMVDRLEALYLELAEPPGPG